jgi:hypothetical protein
MQEQMTREEIQTIVSEYNMAVEESLKTGIPISQRLADEFKDASVGIRGYTANLKASQQALKAAGSGLIKNIVDGESGAAVYNETVNAGAKTLGVFLSKIPYVGQLLEGLVNGAAKFENAVANQADKEYKLYQDLSRNGLALGMDSAFTNLQNAGYTLKEIGDYSTLMKENSQVLAGLAGTAQDGANKFASISKNIANSELETQFMNMGKTVPEINASIANYIKLQQISGRTLSADDASVAQSAAEFIIEQDRITKLTGISADAQTKTLESAQNIEYYAAEKGKLEREAAEFAGTARGDQARQKLQRNALLLNDAQRAGPEAVRQMTAYLAGASNTEDYRKFQQTFSATANKIDSGSTDFGDILNQYHADAAKSTREQQSLATYGVYNKIFGNFSENLKLAGLSTNDYTKSILDADGQIKSQMSATDKATGDMVKLRQAQRNSTQSLEYIFHQAIPMVTTGLAALAETVEDATGVAGEIAGKTKNVRNEKEKAKLSAQDDKNWNNMSTTQQIVSSVPRAIEKVGNLIGLSSISDRAAKSRIESETTAQNTDANALIKFQGGKTGNRGNFDAMSEKVKQSFTAMVKEYGKPVTINSAKRDPADQERLYNAWKNAGGGPGKDTVTGTPYGKITKPVPPGGKDSHIEGRALDLNISDYNALVSSGLAAKYGFSGVANDPGHLQMPSAAKGGILSGPIGGYNTALTDTNVNVPLPDGRSIPAKINNKLGGASQEQVKILSEELNRLDSILNVMQKQNDIASRMLQKQG